MGIVINALKKIGNVIIVKPCIATARNLTEHPYLTFIAMNASLAYVFWYMWDSGRISGDLDGYERGLHKAWNTAYKTGYDNGEAYGRMDERYAQMIHKNN